MPSRAASPGYPAGRWWVCLPLASRCLPGRASRRWWRWGPGSDAGRRRRRKVRAGPIAPTARVARMAAAAPVAAAPRARCAPGGRAANRSHAAPRARGAVGRGATIVAGRWNARPARPARCASATGAARSPAPPMANAASVGAATRISRALITASRGPCSPLSPARRPPIARQGRTARTSGLGGCVSRCAASSRQTPSPPAPLPESVRRERDFGYRGTRVHHPPPLPRVIQSEVEGSRPSLAPGAGVRVGCDARGAGCDLPRCVTRDPSTRIR